MTLPVPTEHDEQVALFGWADVASWGGADAGRLELLHAIPNGGHRHKATAGRLRAEGVRAGVPDLCLPCASADGEYIGLYVELKRIRGGRTSPVQRGWHDRLRAAGHRVEVCAGWQEAARVIADHLALPEGSAPREVAR